MTFAAPFLRSGPVSDAPRPTICGTCAAGPRGGGGAGLEDVLAVHPDNGRTGGSMPRMRLPVTVDFLEAIVLRDLRAGRTCAQGQRYGCRD